MDKTKLLELIDQLREWGVIFDKGLSSNEVKAIENEGKFRFPEDLKAFLQLALPVWEPNYEEHGLYISECFPNWRTRGALIMRMSQKWLLRGILFHVKPIYEYVGIENAPSGTWLETWGTQPLTWDQARTIIETRFINAPMLIPIYSHRFIPAEPLEAGNPIFSVMATDIIRYGSDLVNYFLREFGESDSNPKTYPMRSIRFWDDFL